MNLAQTEKTAEIFFEASGVNYKLYKASEIKEQNAYALEYVPAELTNEEIKEKIDKQVKGFSVIFKFKHVGPNYRLIEIVTTYSLIFPFWKKYFKPNADFDITKEDYREQEVKDAQEKIYFYIQKFYNVWRLYNHS